jgi:predicted metalloprotease
MRWTPGGQSPDIEDRRSQSGGGFGFTRPGSFRGFGGPILGGPGFGGRRMGLGTLLLVLLLSFLFRNGLFNSQSTAPPQTNPRYGTANPVGSANRDAREETRVQFISFVLDDAQKAWDRLLPQAGVPYHHARLVLFRDYTTSACGAAQSATGPFYCPLDEKVYLDLGFFDELANRLGAPGEFGRAYVIAHEIGHHVQKLLGIEQKVSSLRRNNPEAANPLSVRMELRADCLAGVWSHSTQQRDIVDPSDIAAGMEAVAAVGDDRLQKMARGYVSPESFTHVSSMQRSDWFRRGLESGDISSCNSFAQ